ncbi:SdiA-regulated protein [Anseongella ginsenosidimutans]|uniref:SdiA-regulated protein n=1 Tax=Anseongella ginsenosidimutans TaxID=496056 RepID=A0A4R3KPM6_9SPHI|nr:SdiA-regulated domain-containing protein [Anseongella ginsenosidimutans]QEC52429.1 hypothetical protein FRZ59_08845 [Anseongella ginsenosidimutans]TCS85822.1 SdiA-regulated protein [Anseongella ginsenosidimutans]
MKALFLTPLVLVACAGTSSKMPASLPEGYTYENLQEIELEKELEEISGITYDGGGFLAHNDEEGIIYRLDKSYRIKASLPFGEEGDYEELKKVNEALYVLKSKGHIWSMGYDGTRLNMIQEHKWPGEKAEFEAMFYDKEKRSLVLICKNEKGDKETRITRGYAFYPEESRFGKEAVFNLEWDEAARVAGTEIKALHPSAAAVHPLTGAIYILASIEKLLLVADREGGVKEVHRLGKELFAQPEGITFDEAGNLYISNEAGDAGAATLLAFSYQAAN